LNDNEAKNLKKLEEDAVVKAMRESDPNGPLMFYVSKMVPFVGK
jgi:translation elongation factor EF-G